MKRPIITLAAAATLVSLGTTDALAGKADDTLNWSTTREVDVALPFYNNVREMVIMQRHTWDNLLYRDTKTFEYKPLLATSYKWVDDKTLEFKIPYRRALPHRRNSLKDSSFLSDRSKVNA